MSAALLGDPTRESTLQDDLESFLHVLIYAALRYLRHNFTPHALLGFMGQFFDSKNYHQNGWSGGDYKKFMLRAGEISYNLTPLSIYNEDSHPLNAFLSTIISWFGAYYRGLMSAPAPKKQPQGWQRANPRIRKAHLVSKYANGQRPVPRQSKTVDQTQKDKDAKLAAQLNTHAAFWEALETLAYSTDLDWPLDDKHMHALPESNPLKRRLEDAKSEQSSSKRSKVEPARAVTTILRRSKRRSRPTLKLRNTIA